MSHLNIRNGTEVGSHGELPRAIQNPTLFGGAKIQNRRRSPRRAFTLLEIIVVVTIIALLATMVAPRVWRYIGSSKQKVALAEVKALANTVQLYCTDHGWSRPPQDMDLSVLLQGSDPLLSKPDDLIDPWGHPYMMVVPGEANPDFDITSFGADGERGGEGENADITN